MDPERRADATSQIAHERLQPGPATWAFRGSLAAVCLAFVTVAIFVGTKPLDPTAGETAAMASPSGLAELIGVHPARLLSALAGAVAVGATGLAARRLLHSSGAGVLAALLLALDPSLLALSRLAVPTAIAVAGCAVALACFLSPRERMPWAGGGALFIAACADPYTAVWGVPLAALALLRGHIYAAPAHLSAAFWPAIALPVAGAALHVLASRGTDLAPGCLRIGAFPALLALEAPDFGAGIAAVRNPALWFGGLGAIVFMTAGAGAAVATQFRMARLPGRLQLRIAGPLAPTHARGLWLALLAVLVPMPDLWLVVFAIAVAAGVVHLSDDAPGFGLAVAVVVVLVAAVALGRSWPTITGGDASSLGLVPWTRPVACQ